MSPSTRHFVIGMFQFILITGTAVLALPGSTCTVDGLTYQDGASWPSMDGCQQCHCDSGLTFCVHTSVCRDIGQCGVIVTLPGACCPVCYGCVTPSGRKVSLNESWQEDDCTHCICQDGQSKCLSSLCETSCLHPRKVPGECCPVCDDNCTLECHHGRMVDAGGQELCQCRTIAEDFPNLRVSSEDQDSILLATNDALNCPKIHCSRMCPHGFHLDKRGCPVCKCQRCKSIHDCHKKCALGLVHDGRGCPLCQCRSPLTSTSANRCHSGNVSYSLGEQWQLDECTSCICHLGGPTCTETTCPQPCHNPILIPGQCCPICGEVTRIGSIIPGQGNSNLKPNDFEDYRESVNGSTLLTAVLVCVSLVAGLILVVAILALCVAKQCRRLRLHEENMAAAVKLTAVHRLRPKSTNLDYQYNLYLHRYREPSNCWGPLDSVESDKAVLNEAKEKNEANNSHCSNSPLLVKAE